MKGFVYIGSLALNEAINAGREPRDVDAITDFETAKAFLKAKNCHTIYPINGGKTLVGRGVDASMYGSYTKIFEISIAWPGSTNAELLDYCENKGGGAPWPNLNVLYALKMSHRYLRNSPHFYKTMGDIRLMRSKGAQIPDDLQDWFKRREQETYDYGHPSLNRNKSDFFSGDGVTYVYDHDSLHEAVAVGAEPVYRKYVRDGSEVACDKGKWESLSDYDKALAVYEESAVLALERSLIPYPGKWTEEQAWRYALMKVCTSITSGWFREWAWEHYHIIEDVYNELPSYYERFQEGIRTGVVKKNGMHLSR